MTTDAVIELVRMAGAEPLGDRDRIVDGLTAIRRLTSWVEATELRWADALNSASLFPERDLARTNRCSTGVASKVLSRAKTASEAPAFAVGLTDGVLTGEHVDVLTGVLRGDLVTGMWYLNAVFDPATAVSLAQRLDAALQDVYSREVPAGCPRDPIAKPTASAPTHSPS